MANIVSYGGNTYLENLPVSVQSKMGLGTMFRGGFNNPDNLNYAVGQGWLQPYGMQQNQAPAQQPIGTQQIQPQLNRLTQQANNALYGGLLGYNQNMPMMSGGSNPQTFAAPQGDFRSAFAGMQGLLGGR
jgi:hypothetical protein